MHTFAITSLLALIGLLVAERYGYFAQPSVPPWTSATPRLRQVALAFATYFGLQAIIVPALITVVLQLVVGKDALTPTLENPLTFAVGGLLAFSLTIPTLTLYGRKLGLEVWEKWPKSRTQRYKDLMLGVLSWFIAFPLVTVVALSLRGLIQHYFDLPEVDQEAVRLLKSADQPLALAILLPAFVVAGPICEELLFRGFIQAWLRKRVGPRAAIPIAALIFSAVHFSVRQGASNIELLTALFILGCFLSYLYERQGSLLAPIALHCVFNGISVAMILTGIQ